MYYFWSTHSPSAIWVDLAAIADSTELLALNPRGENLIGDVTGQFASAELAY
jgi:choloylglycine hydrolase